MTPIHSSFARTSAPESAPDEDRPSSRRGRAATRRAALGLILAFLACHYLTGCASAPSRAQAIAAGNGLAYDDAQLKKTPANDRVLWEDRAAADAVRRGDYSAAAHQLDAAIKTLGGELTGPEAAATQARRGLDAGSTGVFLGEPYERMMTYYYRGILYWLAGAPREARACFHSAGLVAADPLTPRTPGSCVLPHYLAGLATTLLGGDGSTDLAEARAGTKLSLPSYDRDANVLCFVEFGRGPLKYATGDREQQLRFETTPSRTHSGVLLVAGQKVSLPPYDDLDHQATTRGGRTVDYFLDHRPVFPKAAGTKSPNNDETGKTAPAADTRTWDNLPQYLSFAALRLAPGPHPARLQFYDVKGRLLPEYSRDLTIRVAGGAKETVVFLSELSHG